MTKQIQISEKIFEEKEFQGIYGSYKITLKDKDEVQIYRISLLICGISLSTGLFQWLVIGPKLAWPWLIALILGLGVTLKYIHIYLVPLHNTLKLLWIIGVVGFLLLGFKFGLENMLSSLIYDPNWIWAIGPLFAALTGVGFKEFFCFRRPEAIGLTVLVPVSLISHLIHFFSISTEAILLCTASLSLLILSIRKFGMEIEADTGDKSVFEYLNTKGLEES